MALANKNWQHNVVKAVKAQPGKAAALAALLAVLAFIWVRALGGASGPAMASARYPGAGAAAANNTPGMLQGQAARSTAMHESLREWASRPISPPNRNLFSINYDFFPQDGTRVAVLRAPVGDGFWDRLAKSMTARADAKREQEVLRENLRLQAAQLKVQSTVMGAQPKALINGGLVGEGDVVASFRVLKIEARRVVVEREGIKLELPLN